MAMTNPPSSSPYRFPKPPKPRKQPYRRPVDNASWTVAREGNKKLWEQMDDAVARDKT